MSKQNFLIFVFLGFLIMGIAQISHFITSNKSAKFFTPPSTSRNSSSSENLLKEKVNVLVLGVDPRQGDKGGVNTLILLSVNPHNKSLRAISIPKDSQAEIPNQGINKVNAAYNYGGAELTKKTVENLLQVPVQYYFQLNHQTLAQAVENFGEVDLTFLQQANSNISTDIPTPVLLSLGKLIYQIKDNGLSLETLPGKNQHISGTSYWIVDNHKMQEITKPLL